jgi:hypothetical protein
MLATLAQLCAREAGGGGREHLVEACFIQRHREQLTHRSQPFPSSRRAVVLSFVVTFKKGDSSTLATVERLTTSQPLHKLWGL